MDNLLGDGEDLTGSTISYWGHIWTVTGKNFLGDWNVVRYEQRGEERVRIGSSIAPIVLPSGHPHYAELIPGPCPFCGAIESLKPRYLPTTEGEPWKAVFCMECGAQGPINKAPEKALSLWSQRPETKEIIQLRADFRDTVDSFHEKIEDLESELAAEREKIARLEEQLREQLNKDSGILK